MLTPNVFSTLTSKSVNEYDKSRCHGVVATAPELRKNNHVPWFVSDRGLGYWNFLCCHLAITGQQSVILREKCLWTLWLASILQLGLIKAPQGEKVWYEVQLSGM